MKRKRVLHRVVRFANLTFIRVMRPNFSGRCILSAEQDPIRAKGEVIPPDVPVESNQPHRDSFNVALAVAVIADLLQLVILPLFAAGALSPVDDVLDAAVAVAMVKLVGWHWAFLPSLVTKLIPFVDELPCWTMALLYVREVERAKLQSVQST